MVSEIDMMYKKFKDCNGAVFINDFLERGGYFDVKHGDLTITKKGAKPFKNLPGPNPYFLIEISGKSSLEEKIKTFIHELLHINPPFSHYLDWLRTIIREAEKIKPQHYFVP